MQVLQVLKMEAGGSGAHFLIVLSPVEMDKCKELELVTPHLLILGEHIVMEMPLKVQPVIKEHAQHQAHHQAQHQVILKSYKGPSDHHF